MHFTAPAGQTMPNRFPRAFHSLSNFRAIYRARVMYEAAVEAIGKDVVAKSQKIEDAAIRHAQLQPKQRPLSKDLIPRPVLT